MENSETQVVWDESLSEDRTFLKNYYQSRIEHWKKVMPAGSEKIVKHYKKAIKQLTPDN